MHCVCLVEKNGREKVIADAFFDRCVEHDDANLAFTSFDFHEHCKGMHFEVRNAFEKKNL